MGMHTVLLPCVILFGLCEQFLAGIFLGMGLVNERQRYIVTSSVIAWDHIKKDPS